MDVVIVVVVVAAVLAGGSVIALVGMGATRRRRMVHPLPPGAVRRCRECGCTDEQACWPGCWWVETDLCSACDEPPTRGLTPRPASTGVER